MHQPVIIRLVVLLLLLWWSSATWGADSAQTSPVKPRTGITVWDTGRPSAEALAPVHEAQVISYLKLSGCKIGLLINFNVVVLRDGIRRFINGTF